MVIIFIIYVILGYWATGRTIYRNVVLIYDQRGFFMKRLAWGMLGGWLLIPWALIMMLFGR